MMKYEVQGKTVLLNEKMNVYGFEYEIAGRKGLLGDSQYSSHVPTAIDEILGIHGLDALPEGKTVKIIIEID